MPNADPGEFGRILARLRHARGYTQQDVVSRIPTYYSDPGTYGRIERGDRRPDRDALVAILVSGLLIREVSEINRVLQLAGYNALSADEMPSLGLAEPPGPESVVPPAVPHRNPWWDGPSAGILTGSLICASLIALLIPRHTLFVLLSSCLYAALYVASLYLESSFDPQRLPRTSTATLTFALMLLSSTAALATDRALVESTNYLALPVSLAILVLAGIVQFVIFRRTLSESAIVPASFQTRTAQSAT